MTDHLAETCETCGAPPFQHCECADDHGFDVNAFHEATIMQLQGELDALKESIDFMRNRYSRFERQEKFFMQALENRALKAERDTIDKIVLKMEAWARQEKEFLDSEDCNNPTLAQERWILYNALANEIRNCRP